MFTISLANGDLFYVFTSKWRIFVSASVVEGKCIKNKLDVYFLKEIMLIMLIRSFPLHLKSKGGQFILVHRPTVEKKPIFKFRS